MYIIVHVFFLLLHPRNRPMFSQVVPFQTCQVEEKEPEEKADETEKPEAGSRVSVAAGKLVSRCFGDLGCNIWTY